MLKQVKYFINKHSYLLTVLGIVVFGLFIVFLRRPDAILHPQFWAEDGRFWYADAYNHGPLISLLSTYAGSLQLAMRLIASLSLIAPLRYVPFLFTLAAALVQLLPAVLINLKRFRNLIPSTKIRLLITGFYLVMPAGFEIHVNLTNINWRLALMSFMIIVSTKYKQRLWLLFDHLFLFISGLTGPFSIVLLPIAFMKYQKTRNKLELYIMLNIAFTACIQFLILIFGSQASRLSQPLEPSLALFIKIIGYRIGIALVVGSSFASRHINPFGIASIAVGIAVIALTLFVFAKSTMRIKLFITFCWGLFFASLIKPQASDSMPQWRALLVGAGARYFFLPILCLFICLVYMVFSKKFTYYLRLIGALILLLVFSLAVPSDFTYPPRPNLSYQYFVKEFDHVSPGQTYCMPINPDWNMCLKKH